MISLQKSTISVESNLSSSRKSREEEREFIADDPHGDPLDRISSSGPGKDVVRNEQLPFVSVELLFARLNYTAGAHSNEKIIRIICHGQSSLERFTEVKESNKDFLLITKTKFVTGNTFHLDKQELESICSYRYEGVDIIKFNKQWREPVYSPNLCNTLIALLCRIAVVTNH